MINLLFKVQVKVHQKGLFDKITFCASVFFLPCALLGTRFMRIESGPFRFGSLKFPKLGADDLDISKI